MNKILKNKYLKYITIGVVLLAVLLFFARKRKQTDVASGDKQGGSIRKVPAAGLFDFGNIKELSSPRTPAEAAFVAEYKDAVSRDGIEPPATNAEVEAFKKWKDAVIAQQEEMSRLGGKTTIEAVKRVARAKLDLKILQDIRNGKRNKEGKFIDENGVELV